MAVRHQIVERSNEAVWSVLADSRTYGRWVVGPSQSTPGDGDWPRVGATLDYTVRLGPWSASGFTVVRRSEPPHLLELEAHSGPLGTARISLEVRPWGEQSLVKVDEHPLRGPGGKLHSFAVDAVIQLRHRSMLTRLAEVVHDSTPP